MEQGEETYTPYTVTVNVKEKDDGHFVYSFNAEKESSTRQTLHADVITYKGDNGELFLDKRIAENQEKVNTHDENSSKIIRSKSRKRYTTGELKKALANRSHEKVYTREESMRFLKTVDKKLTFTESEKVS